MFSKRPKQRLAAADRSESGGNGDTRRVWDEVATARHNRPKSLARRRARRNSATAAAAAAASAAAAMGWAWPGEGEGGGHIPDGEQIRLVVFLFVFAAG